MLSTQASPSSPPLPVLDLADLRERAGDDEELVLELLGDFLECAQELEGIADAAAASEFEKTSKLAHRVKGALLTLGAKAAARAASLVEYQASALSTRGDEAGRGSAELLVAVGHLRVCFDEACAAMRAAREASSR